MAARGWLRGLKSTHRTMYGVPVPVPRSLNRMCMNSQLFFCFFFTILYLYRTSRFARAKKSCKHIGCSIAMAAHNFQIGSYRRVCTVHTLRYEILSYITAHPTPIFHETISKFVGLLLTDFAFPKTVCSKPNRATICPNRLPRE